MALVCRKRTFDIIGASFFGEPDALILVSEMTLSKHLMSLDVSVLTPSTDTLTVTRWPCPFCIHHHRTDKKKEVAPFMLSR